MTDLLPCPFCGGEPELNVFYDDDTVNIPNPICDIEFVVVRCPSCGISKEKLTIEAATNWWNTRGQPAVQLQARKIGQDEPDPDWDAWLKPAIDMYGPKTK